MTTRRDDEGASVTTPPNESGPSSVTTRRDDSVAVRIADAAGAFLAYGRGVIELVSPAPFAPGAPTRFEVAGLPLEGKSLGSKRRPEGDFHVRFRLVNLRREHRLRLEAFARDAS